MKWIIIMGDFTAWCISEHIDEPQLRAFINRMYISPRMMMTIIEARELAWREYLVSYYLDKGVLWAMINQIGE